MNTILKLLLFLLLLTSSIAFSQTIRVIDNKGTLKEIENSKWQSSGNTIYNKNTDNVGIGTNSPNASAILEVTSTTKGFLPPRMTTTERDAITTPATGLVIYNTTTNILEVNKGTPAIPVWAASGSFLPLAGGTMTGDIAGTSLTLNKDGGTNTTTIGGGTTTGAVTLGGTGTQSIDVGTGAGVKTVTVGSSNTTSATTIQSGTGALTLTPAVTGTTVIGNTAGTGAITLGSSTGAQTTNVGTGSGASTVNIATGAGVNTVTIGGASGASATTIKSGTGALTLTSAVTGTTVIGNTAGTGTITLGSSTGAQTTNVGTGSGASTVNIATGAGANTVTIGGASGASATTIQSGTGALTLTPAVTGTTVIGNTAGTGAITLGSSTGAQTTNVGTGSGASTVNIATGAGVNTVTIGGASGASATTIKSGTGALTLTSAVTGTTVIGNTAGTGDITLGSSTGAQTINVGTGSGLSTVKIATGSTTTANKVTLGSTKSQVGVGADPSDASAILEVTSTTKGFLPPRMNTTQRDAITTPASGLVIYNTSSNVLQINTGTSSSPIWSTAGGGSFTVGDVKTGLQTSDHSGWVKLDGRLKSTLTSTQQTQATTLGIGANLPNASNAFLVQNGTTLGSISGSNTKTIAQSNLPNVTLGGTSSSNTAGTPSGTIANGGIHNHNILTWVSNSGSGYMGVQGANSASFTRTTVSKGANEGVQDSGSHNHTFTGDALATHSHTITTASMNGGVTQTNLDITPQSLSVNTFIYLGN